VVLLVWVRNPLFTQKIGSEAVVVFSRLKHEKGFRVVLLQAIDTISNPERPETYLHGELPEWTKGPVC
jgi:hypothetical protein